MKGIIKAYCLIGLLVLLVGGCGGRKKTAQTVENEEKKKGETEVVAVKQKEEPTEEKLWEIVRNMDYEEDPIAKIFKGSEFISALAKQTEPKGRPEKMDYDLSYCLRLKDKKEIKSVLEYLNEATKPEEKEVAYYLLATGSLVRGEAGIAIEYYILLASTFPKSIFLPWISAEDLQRLKRAATEDKRIKLMNIPEDEKLWRLAGLYVEVLKVRWNEGEGSFYDLSYPHGLYQQLVQQYPQSSWADNARMELLLYEESFIYEDGVSDLTYTKNFETFVQDYPESECLPKARLKIGEHYFMYACNLVNEAKGMTEEARNYLNQAETYFQEVASAQTIASVRRNANERLQELRDFRDEHTW